MDRLDDEWKLKSEIKRKYPELPEEELSELASESLEIAEVLVEIYMHYNPPQE